MSSEATALASADTSQRRQVLTVLGLACVGLAMVVVFRHFIQNQIRFAFRFPADWGHTLIIPLMAGYLVYLNRDRLRQVQFRTCWLGFVPIVIGIAAYVLFWVGPLGIRHHNLQGASFGLTLFGVVLLLFGWGAIKFLWFPILYLLLFGVRISDRFMNLVTYKMQDIAAKGSWVILKMLGLVFGFDTEISGNTLTVLQGGVEHPLNVAEACSGMRMLVAFLALGVFMAYTGLNRNWQRVTLVILAVPVAIFVNMLRVATLGLLSLVDVDFTAGDFHTFVGLVWLIPALLIYLGIMWVLRRIVVGGEEAPSTPRPKPRKNAAPLGFRLGRGGWTAVAFTVLTLLVCGVGFESAVKALNIHLMKKPVPMRMAFARIPSRFENWRHGEDFVFDEAILQELGTNKYLSRAYVYEGEAARDDEPIHLGMHLTYYTDEIDAVPHVPERCFTAAGRTPLGGARHVPVDLDRQRWIEDSGPPNQRTGKPYHFVTDIDPYLKQTFTVRMPVNEIELRVWVFQDSNRPEWRILAGYFFIANGCATSHTEDVRTLAFDQTAEYAYYSKIEFSMATRSDERVEKFMTYTTDLLDEALPHIMRCLPDWSDVENGRYPADQSSDSAESAQMNQK